MKKIYNLIIQYLITFREKIEDYNFNNPNDFFLKKWLFRILKMLYITFSRFTRDNCVLHASALTYTSLLSLVPILALMFSLLKGIDAQKYFKILLLKGVAANQMTVVNFIMKYMQNANATKLGTFGALSLMLTAILVLTTIEKSFNVIWGVKNTRDFFRKFTDYLSALIIGPVLFVGAMSATTLIKLPKFLDGIEFVSIIYSKTLQYSPYIMLWIAFTFFYIFIPNTKVKLIPGALGGIIAGTLWQIAQVLYIDFNQYMITFKIIYGGLAVLPIFLIWIYISWVIVLFGAELSFAAQNVTNYRSSIENVKLTPFESMQLALIIMHRIVKIFYSKSLDNNNENYISVQKLAIQLNLSERVINHIVSHLYDYGLILIDSSKKELILTPNGDPEKFTVKNVINAILHRKNKSIVDAMESDLDEDIKKVLTIFNRQEIFLNTNLKRLVEGKI